MKFIFSSLCISLLLMSCVKDDPQIICPTLPERSHNPYFPMAIGNYWVFEFNSVLPDGTTGPYQSVDTLRVERDTLISNIPYWVLTTDKPITSTTWIVRDSSGYVLSAGGSMLLTPGPDTTIYNAHYNTNSIGDTIYYYQDMFPKIDLVQTQFGMEECLLQETTHIPFAPFGDEALVDTSYFSNFGPVQRSYAYISGAKIVGTLTDYHLNLDD